MEEDIYERKRKSKRFEGKTGSLQDDWLTFING